MIAKLAILICTVITLPCLAQDYVSKIYRNDSLPESANAIVASHDRIYVQSRNTCLPGGESCGTLRSIDLSLDDDWAVELPLTRPGNENILWIYEDHIIYGGDVNMDSDEKGYYTYKIGTDGVIQEFVHYPLPCEVNIMQGAFLVSNRLYMYGTTGNCTSTSGIDVDGILASTDLISGELGFEYFDYGHLFVDISDLQESSDNSLVFFTRRRKVDYVAGQRDLVIEKILPDGTREDLYSMFIENEFGLEVPNMAVLADGKIVFQTNNQDLSPSGATWRFIDPQGEFLFDLRIISQVWPDIPCIYDIVATNDGGFLAVGKYADRTEITAGSIEFNGLLMKVSGNGDLEWIRNYRNTHGDTGDYTPSSLSAAIELPNGDIVATGTVRNETSDLWVLKVDNQGCLGDDDCGELTTSISEVGLEKHQVNIWPNPASDRIQIEVSSDLAPPFQVVIYDQAGQLVLHTEMDTRRETISLGEIGARGLLHLTVQKDGKVVYSEKVVRME